MHYYLLCPFNSPLPNPKNQHHAAFNAVRIEGPFASGTEAMQYGLDRYQEHWVLLAQEKKLQATVTLPVVSPIFT